MTNQKPINHHYVPRFYLKGFVDGDGKLHVFDRYSKRYRYSAPKGVAYSPDYYTVDTIDEKDSPVVEEGYALVENAARPIIAKLQQPSALTEEERENLALFAAMQYQRVPDAEKRIQEATEKGFKAISQRMAEIIASNQQAYESTQQKPKQLTGEDSELTPEDWAGLANGEKFKIDVTVPHDCVVRQMLETALYVAPYLYQLDWTVLYAPNSRAFITSDSPFVLTGKPPLPWMGIGLITPGSRKYFPLSKTTCLVMGDKPKPTLEFGEAASKQVRYINARVALNSDRFVMASSEPLLRRIVRITKVDSFLTEERVQVR